MIGQLQKNFRKLLTATALYTVFLGSNAYATDISGDQITATTSMPIWGGFTVEQIADGIEPGPSGHNGFTTNAKTGTITFDFDQAYDLDGFKLWNDVVLRAEGIKTFRLDFKTNNGGRLSSQIFEAAARQPDVQIFEVPKVSDVTSVDLVILSSLNEPATATELPTFLERIEVREVAFTGRASSNDSSAVAALEEYVDDLNTIIIGHEDTIRDYEDRITELEGLLTKEKNRADTTFALLQDRDVTVEDQKKEIAKLEAKIVTLQNGPNRMAILGGALGLLGIGGFLGLMLGRRKLSLNNTDNEDIHSLSLTNLASDLHIRPSQDIGPLFPPEIPKEWPNTRWPNGIPRFQIPRKDMPIPPRNWKIDYSKKSGFDSYPVLIPEFKDGEITLRERQFPQDMPNFDDNALIVNSWRGMAIPGSFMMTGQPILPHDFFVIQTAYDAVGRVGYAQEGKAIGSDLNRGTAILIDEQYVITNRHVYEENSDEFESDEFKLGVEFHGEKNSEASDFYEFEKHPPIPLPNMDAIILKLKERVPSSKRQPITFSTIDPVDMRDDDVVVIGYPAEPISISSEETAAMNGDTVFNVKRYSEGKVRMHQTDTDQDMIIETTTSGEYSPTKTVSAICHSASTLEGNSGSAVVCKKTGDLLALHFGYDMFFDYVDEDFNYIAKTNLAIPGILLADIVTSITSTLKKAA